MGSGIGLGHIGRHTWEYFDHEAGGKRLYSAVEALQVDHFSGHSHNQPVVLALEETFADHTCFDDLGAVAEAAELSAIATEVSDR